jgi:hypothetical protein
VVKAAVTSCRSPKSLGLSRLRLDWCPEAKPLAFA